MAPRPDLVSGPHDYWSTEKQPSRGQYEAVAKLAAELLDVPLATRFDAAAATVQLRAACEEKATETAPAPREEW